MNNMIWVKVMMKKLMNLLDTVEARPIYTNLKTSSPLMETRKTSPNHPFRTPKNPLLPPVKQAWTRAKYQRSQHSKRSERKIWRRSRCTIGPKLTKEILMKCIKYSIMPNINSKNQMKCSKLSTAAIQMDLRRFMSPLVKAILLWLSFLSSLELK